MQTSERYARPHQYMYTADAFTQIILYNSQFDALRW